MLQKLIFKLDDSKIPNVEARGSIIQEYSDDPSEFIVSINPDHPFNKQYGWESGICYYVKEIEPGIYQSPMFNFEHIIEMFTDINVIDSYFSILRTGETVDLTFKNYTKYSDDLIATYGVADNINQVKEYYKEAIAHPTNKAIISFVEIRKEDQPEDGGWRWHKWGEYIGTKNPTMEYLYDESDIDSIICFHLYTVKG